MCEFRKFALSVVVAASAMIGMSGCQTASRFAMFGQPKATETASMKKAGTAKPVSHTEDADSRLEDSFYESVEASRLDGTSISHLPPGRVPKKERTVREPGPLRPQGSAPQGVGDRPTMY